MKKEMLLAVCLMLTACEKPLIDEDGDDGNVTLSFIPTTADTTRGTVVIGDYFTKLNVMLFNEEGEKVFDKVKTQTIEDDDFGTLNMYLTVGTYTVVAVGHSSVRSATIKSPDMVQFTASDGEKLTDTFCYCGQVEIIEDGGHFELRMNRVTAMVRFRFNDDNVPTAFTLLKIDYTGGSANFNPTTMEGCTKSTQSELRQAPMPEYYCFTFPYLSNEGLLKMTLSATNDDGVIISQRALTDVPVTRNRITTCTGPLFGDGEYTIVQTGFGITVNGDWDGENYYEF